MLNVKAGGESARVWVDAETFLEVRHDREFRAANGRPSVVTVFYRDYRAFEGLQIPVTVETAPADGQRDEQADHRAGRSESAVRRSAVREADRARGAARRRDRRHARRCRRPGASRVNWRGIGGVALAALLCAPAFRPRQSPVDVGESIYRSGVTGSGAALRASRASGAALTGAAAACINCHQRSGLGMREGRSTVPPIAGRYLFRPLPKDGNVDVPFVEGMRSDREPYTDATLARAIREGLDSQGRPLSVLMPNFELVDTDMAALIAYLKRLAPHRVPGVSGSTLHFATISHAGCRWREASRDARLC